MATEPQIEIASQLKELESQMKKAARNLDFEKAALIRDRIIDLRKGEDYAEIRK